MSWVMIRGGPLEVVGGSEVPFSPSPLKKKIIQKVKSFGKKIQWPPLWHTGAMNTLQVSKEPGLKFLTTTTTTWGTTAVAGATAATRTAASTATTAWTWTGAAATAWAARTWANETNSVEHVRMV